MVLGGKTAEWKAIISDSGGETAEINRVRKGEEKRTEI